MQNGRLRDPGKEIHLPNEQLRGWERVWVLCEKEAFIVLVGNRTTISRSPVRSPVTLLLQYTDSPSIPTSDTKGESE